MGLSQQQPQTHTAVLAVDLNIFTKIKLENWKKTYEEVDYIIYTTPRLFQPK